MTGTAAGRATRGPDPDIRGKIHDTSRLEWTAELPLPEGRSSEEFALEAELEVPASIWNEHDGWAQLQLFARLASPSGEAEDEAPPGNVDALRRATLAVVRRVKVERESLEHEIFTAASLFSRAPRHSLGEALLAGIGRVLAEVRQARTALGTPAPGEPEDLHRERRLSAEFLSNHTLEFLSRIQRGIDEGPCGPRCRHRELYGEMARRLRPQIARALADELAWRAENELLRPDPDDPEALERYVERASLLKKHFQELLFLQAETEFVDRRFKNWFAVAAAIVASVWAFPLGMVISSDRMAGVGVGFTATVVLFSLMYAVKDRIKESVRGWLAERIIRGYGGRVTTLLTPARLFAQPSRLARLRESLSRTTESRPDPLNPEVGAVRQVVVQRHAIRGLVEGDPRLAWQDLTGLKLVVRYDLSPLFGRLDDAVKQIPILAAGGTEVRFAEAPRAYRLPVHLRLRHRGRVLAEDGVLVAHKLGLERLERTTPEPEPAPAPAGDGALASVAISGASERR
jgi:hypothetical protein